MPLKKALHTAARLGASGVEIDARRDLAMHEMSHTAVRQLRKMLDDLNLRVAAVQFRTRRGYDSPDDLDRRIDATKRAMNLAYELGGGLVVNHIGQAPAGDDQPVSPLLSEALIDLGRHGDRAGASLVAETAGQDPQNVRRLIQRLPEGTLGVVFDPGDLFLAGRSPAEAIAALGPWIRHARATDATRDFARRQSLPVVLGRGSLDFSELVGRMEEFQYRGFWTVLALAGEEPVQECANAVSYLKSL